jgi:hypothetical protein
MGFHKKIKLWCKSLSFDQIFLLQVCEKQQWRTLEDFKRYVLEWLIIFPWMNVAIKIKIQTHSWMLKDQRMIAMKCLNFGA